MNKTKRKIKREKKTNKQKTDEQLSPEMVIKIREIRPKRWGRLWWEGL